MDTKCFYKDKFSEDITKAIHGLGYDTPMTVQARVIPYALEKKDLIVNAKTGSGKTAAYAITICELIEWPENKPQALILTPTRELAVQVREDFINIGRLKRINAAAIYGRPPFSIEKAELKQKTHVMAGTPGRVLDHMKKGTLPLGGVNMAEVQVIKASEGTVNRRNIVGSGVTFDRKRVAAYVRVCTDGEEQFAISLTSIFRGMVLILYQDSLKSLEKRIKSASKNDAFSLS
jgi:hypothetical protein